MVRFVKPTDELVAAVAADLREADKLEVWLSHRHDPADAVAASIASSPLIRYVAVDDQGPICAFGVGALGLLSDHGAPWLLGTRRLDEHLRQLARMSRPMVTMMRQRYRTLENWVHAGNLTSVRWLKACGFTIEEPASWGACGAHFHRFWMRS